MAMKFCFSVQKMKLGDMSAAKRHNKREHRTSSQIEDPALWFSTKGHHSLIPWNGERVAYARSKMTRKDAVVGLEFVIQVGNQDDYRNKDKDKTPIKGTGFGAKLNDSINEIHTWATKKFGAENIVSLDLHMDESSPHFHLVVTTVDAEKLNAKKWISGRTSIIELRKSCHEHVNKTFHCKYSNDVPDGGKPHDPARGVAAGVAAKKRIKELEEEKAKLLEELEEAKNRIGSLESQLQKRAVNDFIASTLTGKI